MIVCSAECLRSKPTQPREVLQDYAKTVEKAILECDLEEPDPKDVRRVLEDYRLFSDEEVSRLVAELPQSKVGQTN
jgi:hypothetical protein